jgi:hypothetical protein
MQTNDVGETVNDFLNYAKQRGVQIYPVPYMQLLTEIGKKTQHRKNKHTYKNDQCLNHRRIFCITEIRPKTR